jgi:hypothetical protein
MVSIAVAGGAGPGYFYAPVLALWAVAAVFAGAQTIRLRRRDVATWWLLDIWFRPMRPELMSVKDPTRAGWLPHLALLIFLMIFFVPTLSAQVNSIAYLTGQAPTVSFLPQSHSSQCAQGSTTNCWMSTTGILEDTGTRVVHAGALAIGQPISVRAPVWRWAISGLQLPDDRGAERFTLLGMLVDVMLASTLSGYVLRWLGRRVPGLPWRPRPVPEEDLVPLPVRARPANWSTRNTARKKLKKQHRKR